MSIEHRNDDNQSDDDPRDLVEGQDAGSDEPESDHEADAGDPDEPEQQAARAPTDWGGIVASAINLFAWAAFVGALTAKARRANEPPAKPRSTKRRATRRSSRAQQVIDEFRRAAEAAAREADPAVQAAAQLGVDVDASEGEIRAALRARLVEGRLHPDQGGDAEEAKRLIAAQNALVERARKRAQLVRP